MDGLGVEALHRAGATVQLQPFNFVPARFPDNPPVPQGVNIIRLIPKSCLSQGVPEMPATGQDRRRSESAGSKGRKRELFKEEDVKLQWATVRKAGAGLQNLGNTCFMNSVLQCLTHTPPLAEILLAARQLGTGSDFDPLRMTQQHVVRALQHRSPVIAPMLHAKGLRRVCRSFRLGRQEDAHEYLVSLLDAMHEAILAGIHPKPPREVAQTSFIYRIFGGTCRSQVKCCECGYESNTVDDFLHISLEITRAHSLTKALQRFTTGEYLDQENKYKCPKQAKLVRALKRLTIDRPPNVLVFQLKRFEYMFHGSKISKKVDFETELNIAPYMSNRRAGPQMYELYGVLVHTGHSVHSGHYYCFVRGPNGIWHHMDDTRVSQVSERMVLAQKAYILFYIKKQPENGHAVPAALPERPSTAPPAQRTASLGGEDSLKPTSSSSEREKVTSSGQEPSLVTFSRKGRRQSEPAPAVKAGAGAEPESRKRPADVAAPGARPAQRPRLVPNGILSAPKARTKGVLSQMATEPLSATHPHSSLEGKHFASMNGSAEPHIQGATPGARKDARQLSHANEVHAVPMSGSEEEDGSDALHSGARAGAGNHNRQRGLPGVHSPSGGRSWKRWQEHLSVHSSAMQRKLSNNLSDSSLSGRLSDSAARKATAPGPSPSRLRRVTPALGASEEAPNSVAAQPEVEQQQQRMKHGVALSRGGLKQRLKLPDPDLSEAANLVPNGPAARAQGAGGAKSAPKQPEKAPSASDDEDDSAPPATSAGKEQNGQLDFFGLGAAAGGLKPDQASHGANAAESKGRPHGTRDPAAVRKFLYGSSPGSAGKKSTAGQFGMELPQWDTADEEAVKQAAVFSRAGAPQRKRQDEWDEEYDRGKQKKVKGAQGRDEWEDGGNRFQDAWNSRQHSGGSHHKQGHHGHRGGQRGGRGRGGFRGRSSPRGGGRGRGRRGH